MTRQIATFYMGKTHLGVDILLIKEVYRHMTLSPIPDAPPHLRGLMNLRGRVVTVIDLNICMNRPPADDIWESRLLIFKTREDILNIKQTEHLIGINLGDDIVGFLIDRMGDVLTVENNEILPPPPNLPDLEGHLIEGVIKLGKNIVLLLDVQAILEQVMNVTAEAA